MINRSLYELAALMFRIDLFAFGGGFASVPLMFHEIVEVRGWLEPQKFLDGIALGQVTPGPIVITATFIGYLLHGPMGAAIATIGVFLPSFLILVGVAPFFDRLRRTNFFYVGTRGTLCSFVGLLLAVTIRFSLNVTWDIPRIFVGGHCICHIASKSEHYLDSFAGNCDFDVVAVDTIVRRKATPALLSIFSVGDGSLVVIAELTNSPMTNLDLRFRTPVLLGKKGTE